MSETPTAPAAAAPEAKPSEQDEHKPPSSSPESPPKLHRFKVLLPLPLGMRLVTDDRERVKISQIHDTGEQSWMGCLSSPSIHPFHPQSLFVPPLGSGSVAAHNQKVKDPNVRIRIGDFVHQLLVPSEDESMSPVYTRVWRVDQGQKELGDIARELRKSNPGLEVVLEIVRILGRNSERDLTPGERVSALVQRAVLMAGMAVSIPDEVRAQELRESALKLLQFGNEMKQVLTDAATADEVAEQQDDLKDSAENDRLYAPRDSPRSLDLEEFNRRMQEQEKPSEAVYTKHSREWLRDMSTHPEAHTFLDQASSMLSDWQTYGRSEEGEKLLGGLTDSLRDHGVDAQELMKFAALNFSSSAENVSDHRQELLDSMSQSVRALKQDEDVQDLLQEALGVWSEAKRDLLEIRRSRRKSQRDKSGEEGESAQLHPEQSVESENGLREGTADKVIPDSEVSLEQQKEVSLNEVVDPGAVLKAGTAVLNAVQQSFTPAEIIQHSQRLLKLNSNAEEGDQDRDGAADDGAESAESRRQKQLETRQAFVDKVKDELLDFLLGYMPKIKVPPIQALKDRTLYTLSDLDLSGFKARNDQISVTLGPPNEKTLEALLAAEAEVQDEKDAEARLAEESTKETPSKKRRRWFGKGEPSDQNPPGHGNIPAGDDEEAKDASGKAVPVNGLRFQDLPEEVQTLLLQPWDVLIMGSGLLCDIEGFHWTYKQKKFPFLSGGGKADAFASDIRFILSLAVDRTPKTDGDSAGTVTQENGNSLLTEDGLDDRIPEQADGGAEREQEEQKSTETATDDADIQERGSGADEGKRSTEARGKERQMNFLNEKGKARLQESQDKLKSKVRQKLQEVRKMKEKTQQRTDEVIEKEDIRLRLVGVRFALKQVRVKVQGSMLSGIYNLLISLFKDAVRSRIEEELNIFLESRVEELVDQINLHTQKYLPQVIFFFCPCASLLLSQQCCPHGLVSLFDFA